MKFTDISDSRVLLALFVLSTSFFLCEHYANFSWDFAAYATNAQYWAGMGSYYEHSRPPMMPFMLFALSALPLSEYIFVIAVSALFFLSSIKLADALKIDRKLFYLLLLSPYVLIFGTVNGTELLSLAFIQLAVAFTIERKNYSGLFLGLAFITRYNMIIFLPLLLTRNIKMLVKNVALFVATVLPWLAYSFHVTGNMFTSIADIYALMFKFREAFQPLNQDHLFFIGLFLIPLALLGFVLSVDRINTARKKSVGWIFLKERRNMIMVVFAILVLYTYFVNPLKDVRYAFALVTPIAYFAAVGLTSLGRVDRGIVQLAVAAIMVLNVLFVAAYVQENPFNTGRKFVYALEKTRELGIAECSIMSNGWVPLNYFGLPASPSPDIRILDHKINEGNIMIMFRSIEEPEWARNYLLLRNYPLIYEDDELTIIGDSCIPAKNISRTYMERMKETVKIIKNVEININPCFIIFSDNELLERSCNFLNFKGFSVDANRCDATSVENTCI